MNHKIKFEINAASLNEITEHLMQCDQNFVPNLSSRILPPEYALKIYNNAVRFEAWSSDNIIGLVAAYCNDTINKIAFITSVSVVPEFYGRGIANYLIEQCIKYCQSLGFSLIKLEVNENNTHAINLYKKNKFHIINTDNSTITMQHDISKES